MSLIQQELEENLITEIENDCLENLKKYIECRSFHINSILRSRHKVWETNCMPILAIASYSGSENIVEYLLNKNVDVNQIDALQGRSALHWAVVAKKGKIVKLLIESGAIVNIPDRYSITPLLLCAHHGDIEILRTLIRYGANVNLTDRMNTSALGYACIPLKSDIIKELIMNGCKYSSSFPYSLDSPLKTLILNGEYLVARMLIESGWDLKNEKWLLNNLARGDQDNHKNEFYKWLRNHIKNPMRLLSLCRLEVRKNILKYRSNNFEDHVSELKIPKLLKDYLMMKN